MTPPEGAPGAAPAKPADAPAGTSAGTPATPPADGGAPSDPENKLHEPTPPDLTSGPPPADEKSPLGGYDLKLPDEFAGLNEKVLERTAAASRELGLTNDQAQKVLELLGKEATDHHKAFVEAHQPGGEAWNARMDEWETAAMSDKELAPDESTFKANQHLAARVAKTFLSSDLLEELEETGYGSHPEVLRALVKIGKAMSEDTLVMPAAQTGGATKDAAELLYGKDESKK